MKPHFAYWVFVLVAAMAFGDAIGDARAAHDRADGVLWPRLTAAMNEWATGHVRHWNDSGHLDKFNAIDKASVGNIREAFRKWDDAMKEAGY